MTETPQNESTVAADAEEADAPSTAHCRHCGQPHDLAVDADPDWLCPSCDRYQDATICPTCKGLARISLLPADVVPEPHAPVRRKRS